jgi:tetratricopeptide (TPR) repeat protein
MTAAQAEAAAWDSRALERLLDYYERVAAVADAHISRQVRARPLARSAPAPGDPVLRGRAEALEWMRAERGNLLACLDHAALHGDDGRVAGLTAGLSSILRLDGPWELAVRLHGAVVAAARRLGDQTAEATALTELGALRREMGDRKSAEDDLMRALRLSTGLEDRLGEANALTELARLWRMTGRDERAGQALERAQSLYLSLGDRLGQATVLTLRGAVQRNADAYPEALLLLE